MFGTLGGPEVVLILVIALIVFGPRRLPEIGKSMGKVLAEFRKASNDFKRTIEDEVEAEKAKEPPPASSLSPPLEPSAAGEPPPTVTTIDPAAYGYDAGQVADSASGTPAEPPGAAGAAAAPEPEGSHPVAVGAPAGPQVESPAEPTVSRGRSVDEQ
jgi:TatA/E family protein of Tat protein translocase